MSSDDPAVTASGTDDFNMIFPDEDSCRKHLYNLRWPSGFRCPLCGNYTFYNISSRHLYECRKCGRQTSLTAGTVMHGTRLPLLKWFRAINLLSESNNGKSTMHIQKAIGVSYPTAWTICGKIRLAMQEQDADIRLAGIIQAETDSFGTRVSKNCGDKPSPKKIQGCIVMSLDSEGRPNRIIGQLTDIDASEICRSILKRYISRESVVQALRQLTLDVISKPDPNNGSMFSIISGKEVREVVRQIHRFISTRYRGQSRKYLQVFIDEFCYRSNRGFRRLDIMHSILSACVNGSAHTYEQLIA